MDNIYNRWKPYKNREINLGKEVEVYRCLNRKGEIYSIRQEGLVVAHTDALTMRDVKFVVNQVGKNRCKKQNIRNIHAYIKGKVATEGVMGTTAVRDESIEPSLPAKIIYDPYSEYGFVCTNLTKNMFEVESARGVTINKHGVYGSYLNQKKYE